VENPENGDFTLDEALYQIFNPNDGAEEYDFIFCDPLFGFSGREKADLVSRYQEIAGNQRKDTQALSGRADLRPHTAETSEIVRAMVTQNDTDAPAQKPIVVVVNFASRLVSSPEHLNAAETTMFLNLFYASKNSVRVDGNKKTLILIADKLGDIPAWFYLNNPNVRTLSIPNPDRAAREIYVNSCFDALESEALAMVKSKFIDMTEGMKLLELDELRRLYPKSNIPIENITDTVSIYKFGFKENKWEAMRDKIEKDAKNDAEWQSVIDKNNGYIAFKMSKRVKGQEQAIKKISQIIQRSITGLSGMQHSASGNKPRGIMFLAGPTGTGKTEIVKTVAEFLFGDEKALIRFDMSEYNIKEADQKLFGAPPGYTGYEQGGQLTNAVKSNPFSVLLFDEIEKAHPSIMDKFLQILEDGRMTDGQGNTVYFSETLIFFTSNAGISEEICDTQGRVIERKMIVLPENSYDEIQEKVEAALKTKFKPEILNRIGKNIIVFNYISEFATKGILDKQLDNIIRGIVRKSRIEILVEESAMKYLIKMCLEKETRENGGRGIGNVVESEFINPLAEYIFAENTQPGNVITVSASDNKIVFERRA
jgi:hypothetical protein